MRVAVHETYDEELAWLPEQVHRGPPAMETPAWREIGVLTRDNAHAADVFDALTRAEIPVEIVGLQGLLRLPEVAEVVATLTLLHDLTANAELLTLLTGPRWAIGARDLALLGRRARHLTRFTEPRERDRLRDLAEELEAAVAGADPTEVVSLSDALEDPGETDYSEEARERFGLLAAELRYLRAHSGEPLLDLVRRIIDTTGIDVELASSVSPAAQARRDNLDLFVKAVAEFQAVDGDRHAAGAAGLPAGRGRVRLRPRRRHPDRGGLGQAAHGAPRPRGSSGTPSSWSGWRRAGSRPAPPGPSGPTARPCCRTRCAATPATCRRSAAGRRRSSSSSPTTARPTSCRRSCASGTSR